MSSLQCRIATAWSGPRRTRHALALLWLWAVLLCAAAECLAAAPMRFDRLGIDEGLAQQSVNTIAQDATGFMWFGTEDGLDRYDGYTFQHQRHDRADPASLPNDYIADIQPDTSGHFWLATDGASVVWRADSSGSGGFQTILDLIPPQQRAGLERVRVLRFDSSGRLWIGSREAGVALFDPKARQLLRRYRHRAGDPTSLSDDAIFSLLVDSGGSLWVGTLLGLDQLDPGSGRVSHWPLQLGTARVRSLLEESPGRLWIGTTAGLARLDRGSGLQNLFRHDPSKLDSLPSDEVNVLYRDSGGRLWVGTSAGLALWNPSTGGFHTYHNDPADPSSLPDDHIVSLREDRSGLLWVGTKFGGLARWNPRTWSLGQHLAGPDESMASRNVMAFTEDASGRLWIGTFGGGLSILDPGKGASTTLRQIPNDPHALSDDRVMALITDRSGFVWAGTMAGGLDRIDPQTRAVKVFGPDSNNPESLPAPGIMSLLEDSNGRLWVGTYGGGLCSLERATGECLRYPSNPKDPTTLASARVTALAEDRTGRLWVGTDGGGLHVLDPITRKVFRLRHDPHDPHSLSAATVYSLHVDRAGTVWVGTRGGGLDRVIGTAREPEGIRFENLSERNGLPNNTIYGIHSDAAGRLWVSTNHGLARLNPKSGEVRIFHRSHGLQEEEFNFGAHYASRSGRLFFGGASGYNTFDPEKVGFDNVAPPVVITAVRVLDRQLPAVPLPERVHLRYRDVLAVDAAALDFAAPAANTFQFELEGFDRDWQHAGTRHSVSYTNLPGGHYTLRVRAANPDGVWNERGIGIQLDVDPPPWESWWAYTVYALLMALLIVGCWLAHLRSLRREARYSRRLEEEVRDRTRELAARNAELETVNRRLEQASLTDPLTGLGNRRSLIREMPRLIAAAQSGLRSRAVEGQRMTLMLVDLDHLKPINDQYGHEAGDQVLEQVSQLLLGALRDADRVVRWGGDEFVVVRTRSNLEDGALLAEDIRRCIARTRFKVSGARPARTSCSIGFACYPFIAEAPSLSSWEDVLNMADMALYRAKERRNAWLGWCGRAAAAECPELSTLLATDPAAAETSGWIEVRRSSVPENDTMTQRLRESRAGRRS